MMLICSVGPKWIFYLTCFIKYVSDRNLEYGPNLQTNSWCNYRDLISTITMNHQFPEDTVGQSMGPRNRLQVGNEFNYIIIHSGPHADSELIKYKFRKLEIFPLYLQKSRFSNWIKNSWEPQNVCGISSFERILWTFKFTKSYGNRVTQTEYCGGVWWQLQPQTVSCVPKNIHLIWLFWHNLWHFGYILLRHSMQSQCAVSGRWKYLIVVNIKYDVSHPPTQYQISPSLCYFVFYQTYSGSWVTKQLCSNQDTSAINTDWSADHRQCQWNFWMCHRLVSWLYTATCLYILGFHLRKQL